MTCGAVPPAQVTPEKVTARGVESLVIWTRNSWPSDMVGAANVLVPLSVQVAQKPLAVLGVTAVPLSVCTVCVDGDGVDQAPSSRRNLTVPADAPGSGTAPTAWLAPEPTKTGMSEPRRTTAPVRVLTELTPPPAPLAAAMRRPVASTVMLALV